MTHFITVRLRGMNHSLAHWYKNIYMCDWAESFVLEPLCRVLLFFSKHPPPKKREKEQKMFSSIEVERKRGTNTFLRKVSDEKMLFSFVYASCTYNSPIKERKCLFSLGVSEIDYLTMRRHPNVQRLRLLSQIRPFIHTVKDSRAQIALISDRFHTCLVFKVLMQNTIKVKKEWGLVMESMLLFLLIRVNMSSMAVIFLMVFLLKRAYAALHEL